MRRTYTIAGLGLLLLCGACSVSDLAALGRPCSADEPCGPGTYCHPATGTCVKAASTTDANVSGDAPRMDAQDVDALVPDSYLPDTLAPDAFIAPDSGCPSGYTLCGKVCAKLDSDINHCGGCGKACPGGSTDACINSKCVCGKSGACTGDRNCIAGSCACVKGGLCQGCCNGNTCVGLSGQSKTICGAGGAPCSGCDLGTVCSQDSCVAGACTHTPASSGKACSDGKACTHTDVCAGTTCAGTPYTCGDNLACTTDSCTGNAADLCSFTLQSGYCLIGKACVADKVKETASGCNQCLTAYSTGAWAPAPGCVATLAGNTNGGYKDGPALSAQFKEPTGVAVASAGIYVADNGNNRVRLVAKGVVSTVAGSGSGYVDGSVLVAKFHQPNRVAVGPAGAYVDVADEDNNRIRRIVGGAVITLAGGSQGYVNGALLTARFNNLHDLVSDGQGGLLVADTNNHRIRKVSGGQVTTLAGSVSVPGYLDGPAASARFALPKGLTYHVATKRAYVADTDNNAIRLIDGGAVTTFAGMPLLPGGFADGAAAKARFAQPKGIVVNSSGALVYVADTQNQRIRKIAGGIVSTSAGSGSYGHEDGPVGQAKFKEPYGLTLDETTGLIYVADRKNHCIRVINP